MRYQRDKVNDFMYSSDHWASIYQQFLNPSQEMMDKCKRAFDAALAYEKNCAAKYDYPDWMQVPSRPPKKGESMADFACRYGTTTQEMKECWQQVERALLDEKNAVR